MCARGKDGLRHKYIPFVDSGRNTVSFGHSKEQTVTLIVLANEKIYFYRTAKETLCNPCQYIMLYVICPI